MPTDLTQDQVGRALAAMGNYRVMRAQVVGAEGGEDGISGVTLLCLGLRETGGRNIEGGAKLVDGKWVATQDDVGVFQINRAIHKEWLGRQVAVKAGTWGPPVMGRTPREVGFCPRFEESLRFVIAEMRNAIAFGMDSGMDLPVAVQFAIAAHNAGVSGAMTGFREGNVDLKTTGGDYSAWVLRHRTLVNRWLGQHPNWRM